MGRGREDKDEYELKQERERRTLDGIGYRFGKKHNKNE